MHVQAMGLQLALAAHDRTSGATGLRRCDERALGAAAVAEARRGGHRLEWLGHRVTSIPRGFENWGSLTHVNLDSNGLRDLQALTLNRLVSLSVATNRLTALPADLGVWPETLQHLDASGNYLTTLPRSFEDLHKLRYADLSNNAMTHLPDLAPMRSLVAFDLGANQRLTREGATPEWMQRRDVSRVWPDQFAGGLEDVHRRFYLETTTPDDEGVLPHL
ncbi:MAG: uncharacterized protein JWQ11_809 [Rhizobacter sp.]|nr:uncharacterized protein [Rhizobacter sp.]